ncbi:MAG: hypothetical protein V3V08_10555 [Nannocystaceae bacterium]
MITLMAEDNDTNVPQQSSLQNWASLGATFWIVSDANGAFVNKWWPAANYWGMDKLLKPGVEVAVDNPVGSGNIKPQ